MQFLDKGETLIATFCLYGRIETLKRDALARRDRHSALKSPLYCQLIKASLVNVFLNRRLSRSSLCAPLILLSGVLLSACNLESESYDVTTENSKPQAYPARFNVMLNGNKTINLEGTDTDNDSLSYRIITDPGHGDLSGSGNVYTYTPVSGFIGTDIFTYQVHDGAENSTVARVTLSVVADNGTPSATPQAVNVLTNTQKTIILSGTDDNTASSNLSYRIVARPSYGIINTLSGRSIEYTPFASFNGEDLFSFSVSDGTATSTAANVTMTVNSSFTEPESTVPVTYPGRYDVLRNGAIDFSLQATDPKGTGLTYYYAEEPENGEISGTPPYLTYTAGTDFIGSEKLKFYVNDGSGDSAIGIIRFDVEPANSAPVGYDDYSIVVLAGETMAEINLNAIFIDSDQDELNYSIPSQTSHGTLEWINKRLFYTPYASTNTATDRFRISAHDGLEASNIVLVDIQIIDNPNG